MRKVLHWIAWVLVVIGGLNWGLVGLFNFDLVQALGVPILATVIYVLVGLAALWMVFSKFMKKGRRRK